MPSGKSAISTFEGLVNRRGPRLIAGVRCSHRAMDKGIVEQLIYAFEYSIGMDTCFLGIDIIDCLEGNSCSAGTRFAEPFPSHVLEEIV
jgi:hypothetical protein